tara:strand:+ start:291 stop:644 length:354 start_codon:yes stop_codon:yes gene_type:complete
MKESLCELTIHSYTPKINFTFLNALNDESYIYYSIPENIEEYKLKNLYRFIYLRILKLHKQFSGVPKMKLIKESLTYKSFNTYLDQYIQGNRLLAILIIQSLYHYKYPKQFKKQLIP